MFVQIARKPNDQSYAATPERPAWCGSTRARNQITYPFARLHDGTLIHIDNYDGSSAIRCLGCDDAMVARLGEKVRWHFAHRSAAGATCSYETALHAAAKQAIREGFTAAKAAATSYLMLWQCEGCDSLRSVDLVPHCDSVIAESEMVPGVISDLAFHGARRFAVEIVVTHPPEAQALARCEAAKTPIFVVRPDWDTMATLFECLHVDDSHFVDRSRCPECVRHKQAREGAAKARAQAVVPVHAALANASQAPEPLRPWERDARGKELFPSLQRTLHATGERLRSIGFRQARSKPWLFVFNVRRVGSFFANLGGTPEVPIWSDPTPLFHWALDEQCLPHEAPIVQCVRAHLETHGVAVRKSFHSTI